MRGLKRFFAIILALVFLLLLPLALLGLAVQGLLLNPDFYKQQLVKANVYSRVYAEVLPELTKSLDPPKEFPVTQPEILELVRRLVPESFVRVQTEKAIDEVFDVLTSKKDSFQIIIPLRDIKQRAPDEVVALMERKLAALPPCSGPPPRPDQMQGFPTCLPTGPAAEAFRVQFLAEATSQIRKMIDNLPDNLDATQQMAEGSGGIDELRSRLETPRKVLGDVALGMSLFYALVFVVLILVGILGGNSFNSGVGWVGVTLLISGFAVVVVSLVASSFAPSVVALLSGETETPKEIVAIMSPLLLSAIEEVVRRVQMEAGGITVAGAIVLFISRMI